MKEKSIEIKGEIGKIIFFPYQISENFLYKIERRLEELVSCRKEERDSDEGYMNADEVLAILRKNNPLIDTPGGAIKAYRAREELTQKQLAKKCGLRQSHLSEMERNKRPIGLKVAKKLAKVLKIDYRKLV